MKKRKIFAILGLLAVVVVSWLGIQTSRAGYESAEYESVEKSGKFEIRNYSELTTVATPAAAKKDQDSGFMRLFRFISGNNEAEQKIAMTTPVFMPSDESGKSKSMHFVVPKKVAAAGVPSPKADSVSIEKISGGKYAALRFAGARSADNEKEALAILRDKLKERGLATKGTPMFAYYDPPWTPGFLRRNEVLLKLK